MITGLKCWFRGKPAGEVEKMAAGPGGLDICKECVATRSLIMAGRDVPPTRFDPRTWPTARVPGVLAALDATAASCRENRARAVYARRARGVGRARMSEPSGVSRQAAWEPLI